MRCIKTNDMKNATRKLDSELLARLSKEVSAVIDRTGKRAVYYVPSDKKFTDVCQYTFAKYGVPMKKYKSSLHPYHVLKIMLSEIDQLSNDAREFLFSVNPNSKKLQDILEQIMVEMGQKSK